MTDTKSFLKSAALDELRQLKHGVEAEIAKRQGALNLVPKVKTFTDGASRGNPGQAGIGALIYDENDRLLKEECRFIGETTNNEAEYRALLLALDLAGEFTQDAVDCYMDSQLLVRQLNGQYALKSEKLGKFFHEVKAKAARFQSVSFRHVSRENNFLQLADRLANKAIDQAKRI